VALPTLMLRLHATLAATEWVILIYLLTISTLLLFWGHLASVHDPEGIYHYGMLLFGLGSLLCTAAPTIHTLILFRFIQGLGASMMMAVGPALIKRVFPPEQLGRGLGMIGIATSLGLLCGPVVSGFLIHYLHWRMIFLVTVPVSLFFYFLWHNNHGNERQAKSPLSLLMLLTKAGSEMRLNLLSLLLWIGSITMSVLLANSATLLCSQEQQQHKLLLYLALLLVLIGWTLFFKHEQKALHPLLPRHLFARRFFSMAVLTGMLSFTVLFFVLLLVPFYLARIKGLRPDTIGMVMMAVPVLVFLVSPIAGRLFDRFGARLVATTGQSYAAKVVLTVEGLDVTHTVTGTIAGRSE
jgi:MFS family permease